MPNRKDEILEAEKLKSFLKQAELLKYFTKENLLRLNRGEQTTFIKNVHYEGKVWDGMFQLIADQDGTYILHFNKCAVPIEIPDKVLGKKLSGSEKTLLQNGDVIGPFRVGNHEIYFHIDKDTNSIAVYFPKNIGIPDEIMGYRLSSFEKRMIDGGNAIGPKVFCADGHYFIGHFSVEKHEGLYLWKTHYDKELSKREAAKLSSKYNEPPEVNINREMTELQQQILFVPPPPEREILESIPIPYYPLDNESLGKTLKNKDISLYQNNTFNIITLNIKKEKGIPAELFKYSFSQDEINRLKNGETLHNRTFTFASGDKIKANVNLTVYGEINRIELQINSKKKNGHEQYIESGQKFDLSELSVRDKQIMDLLDKRYVRELNSMAENGIKPSTTLKNLIYTNTTLNDNDKRMVTAVFNLGTFPANSQSKPEPQIRQNEASNEIAMSSSKTVRPKIAASRDNKSNLNNKRHVTSSVRSLFHDM